MPKHFTHRFDRNAIGEGDGRCKGMPCQMEGDIFLDAANLSNFFQVGIHLLIGYHGKDGARDRSPEVVFVFL